MDIKSPGTDHHNDSQPNWVNEYIRQLEWQLNRTAEYVTSDAPADVRRHGRSYLTLLQESHHYAKLTPDALNLIAQLHPLPVRWGWGHLWEAELRFALEHTPEDNIPLLAAYHCGLVDIYLPVGRFEDAVLQAKSVLAMDGVPAVLGARAVRSLFTCYRSTGQHSIADQLMREASHQFNGDLPAESVPAENAQGWLIYNQSQLELLREQGKIDEGLELVEQMIRLDHSLGRHDPLLTADLVTHRSTLLWNRARYHESVTDLRTAMELYSAGGDPFNAESLQSNLGLVYWTMGELDLAEKSLQQAINYYRQTGSDQLITYDLGNLGLTYFARGNLPDALRLTEEHIAHAQALNFITEANRGRRNLGTVLVYLDRTAEAVDELTAMNNYFKERGSRYGFLLDFLWLALCYKAQGDEEKGKAEALKVFDWCQKNDAPVLHQLALRCLAYFLPLKEQAPLLRQSLELARQLNRSLEAAAVLLMLGRAADDTDQGLEYWQSGSDLMTRMGAGAWLEGHSLEDPPFYPMFL